MIFMMSNHQVRSTFRNTNARNRRLTHYSRTCQISIMYSGTTSKGFHSFLLQQSSERDKRRALFSMSRGTSHNSATITSKTQCVKLLLLKNTFLSRKRTNLQMQTCMHVRLRSLHSIINYDSTVQGVSFFFLQ